MKPWMWLGLAGVAIALYYRYRPIDFGTDPLFTASEDEPVSQFAMSFEE